MKKYTVILLYPEDRSETGGLSYLAHVNANDAVNAARAARRHCAIDNGIELEDTEDFAVIAAFLGHLEDEWSET